MLKCVHNQSVGVVIATPHFCASKKTIDAFLLYRKVLTFRNHDMRNARTEADMVSDEGDQKR
jgi:hypothetical protein